MLAGALAGVTPVVLLQPLDVIRTRLQVSFVLAIGAWQAVYGLQVWRC